MIHREQDIRQWGIDRGIYTDSDPFSQFFKLQEEVDELRIGLADGDDDQVSDAIGDCIVVLAHIAKFHGATLEDCIEHAWQEIKDRTGRMVDGVWVKDT